MKMARVLIVVTLLAAVVSAADVNGKWKLKFLGDPGKQPKTVGEVVLELKADGNKLTGVAHIGSWPGTIEITDGKIDGGRFSFVVVGKSAWQSSGPQGKASGLPRVAFKGAVEGQEIKAQMTWDSVMIYGNSENKPVEFELAGERVRD